MKRTRKEKSEDRGRERERERDSVYTILCDVSVSDPTYIQAAPKEDTAKEKEDALFSRLANDALHRRAQPEAIVPEADEGSKEEEKEEQQGVEEQVDNTGTFSPSLF